MKSSSLFHGLALVLVLSLFQSVQANSDISTEKQSVIDQVDSLQGEIESISMELWKYSEIALTETRSAEFVAKAAFDEQMKDNPYVSPIPKGQKPILPE